MNTQISITKKDAIILRSFPISTKVAELLIVAQGNMLSVAVRLKGEDDALPFYDGAVLTINDTEHLVDIALITTDDENSSAIVFDNRKVTTFLALLLQNKMLHFTLHGTGDDALMKYSFWVRY